MKFLKPLTHRTARWASSKYTTDLDQDPKLEDIKTFRLIDNEGNLLDRSVKLLDAETSVYKRIFQKMVEVEIIDKELKRAHNEGLIPFYMTSLGETGAVVGSVAALSGDDMLMTQYREMSALYWRGFTIKEITDNCLSNAKDQNKGRQMPIHFSCSRLNFFSVSSPSCTQVPQAAGHGYGFRTKNERKIVATYFGEGSASEGDFYAALNFAQTLKSQTLFFCRNNGFAISTPIHEQTSGDQILPKALSFGIKARRVDGNDPVAVYRVVKALREYIVTEQKPAFVEAMTYRLDVHVIENTCNHYRDNIEVQAWRDSNYPIARLEKFLQKQGIIGQDFMKDLAATKERIREAVNESLRQSMNEEYPPLDSLFEDVYDKPPGQLRIQQLEFLKHVARNQKEYERRFQLSKYGFKAGARFN